MTQVSAQPTTHQSHILRENRRHGEDHLLERVATFNLGIEVNVEFPPTKLVDRVCVIATPEL